jgi:hypothetical protein
MGEYSVSSEPFFAFVGFLLGECELDQFFITLLHSMKLLEMLVEIVEIDLCVYSSTRSQTLHVRDDINRRVLCSISCSISCDREWFLSNTRIQA